MRHNEKFGVPALAGSCASEARRNPTKVGTPNAKQNPAKLLLTCLVALVTSNTARAGQQSRVEILLNSQEGKQSGLQFDSVIVTDNLATVQNRFIEKTIGNLSSMKTVERALAHTFGLKLSDE